jgi:hypothetical protein
VSELILDCHAHCGVHLPFPQLSREWLEAGIDGGVVLAPVEKAFSGDQLSAVLSGNLIRLLD